jgi:transposase
MKAALPSQPVVHPDETGWREGGRPRWLWAFVAPDFTVYRIAGSRGSDVILAMLTAEFAGLLGRDGWAPYLCLEHAVMQTCLAHFLRRCNEILEIAEGRAAEYPRAVKALIGDALDLRDRKDELPEAGFAERRAALEERVEDLAARSPTWEPNRKLANHFSNERAFVLAFLYFAAVEATNWPGEHAMRFAVTLRKTCGGNRTPAGSRAQETLISILRTCRQQGRDAVAIFVAAQHSREPLALDLTGPPPVPFDQIPHRTFTRTAGPARRRAAER